VQNQKSHDAPKSGDSPMRLGERYTGKLSIQRW